jgi:hypothetical protein
MILPITTALNGELYTRYGLSRSDVQAIQIEDREAAKFFGEFMVSALQTSATLDRVEDGSIVVWAIAVEDRVYGAGVTVDSEGRYRRLQSVFARCNRHDAITEELDQLLDETTSKYNAAQ